MDKTVFRAFETYWDEEVLKFWRQHPDRSISKERFGKFFTPVWNKAMSVTVTNIVSGFRVTGIFPFDRNTIPDAAFTPSDVTSEEKQPGTNHRIILNLNIMPVMQTNISLVSYII